MKRRADRSDNGLTLMKTELFDYHLPEGCIAQSPAEPRESAKLLILNKDTGAFADARVANLPEQLNENDLLVLNTSKVFHARILGTQDARTHEVFFLHPEGETWWVCLIRKAKKLKLHEPITLEGGKTIIAMEKHDEDGTMLVDVGCTPEAFFAYMEAHGSTPLPPYIEQTQQHDARYQTVFAQQLGSAAAPTAGLHLTQALLERIRARGTRIAHVVLHVGLGTFRPVQAEDTAQHAMHSEWAHVSEETIRAIQETRARGGRVIAIGTTALRALESANNRPFEGWTDIFITPGYTFNTVDALLTNFHLPKSTLLMLVSAFASREYVLRAYQHAIDNEYRFFSYGDAMFIA